MSFKRIVDHLKDPRTVVKVQEYFGIQYIPYQHENSEITSESSQSTDEIESDSVHYEKKYDKSFLILNKFWYWTFIIGTELGDEIFYATFIPFWFWNIDGAVGRRVIMVWSSVMYIGQALKDIFRIPRPGSPVIRLQSKWSAEYGMPSTHAMVAISIPFSVLIFTQDRYFLFLFL